MRPRTILGVLLLGAVVLRVLALGDRLSHDEGYTWLVASAHSPAVFYDRLTAYENTPPLYYLLTWPLPNAGVAWLRLPSVLAGVACVGATYWTTKVTFTGYTAVKVTFASIAAAAALAVAPFAVSYSDYARGFVLSDAFLIAALGAAVQKRWWLYLAAGTAAVYTEYDAALFLIAIAIALREWRAALPVALLIPWIPAAIHANNATGATKVSPIYPDPSAATLRDTVVRLVFGEHGTAHAASVRWLQFLLVAAVGIWAFQRAPRLLWQVAALVLGLHAVTHWIGPDIFAPRYLTELIPLAAIALGCALAASGRRIQIAGMVCIAALGIGVAIKRTRGNGEPDVAAIGRIVAPAARGRRVLTNSAVVAYYLRGLHPHLDRPFGLGRGMRGPAVVVEDTRVANSPRPGTGPSRSFGPIYVRITRK